MKNLFSTIALLIFCFHQSSGQVASRVEQKSFFSSTLNRELNYQVYLPATYEKESSFPILYLLHGHGGDHLDWIQEEEGNAQYLLDSLIGRDLIPPIVAVTLDAGNSWYVDSGEKMESAYVKEFIPLVEGTYKLDASRASRMIAGNSAGGYGSLRFGLKYPELFHSVILLSPAAYYPAPPLNSSSRKIDVFAKNGQLDTAVWQSYSYINLFREGKSYPTFYLSTGDDDEYRIFDALVPLRKFFTDRRILQELTVINGGHTWEVWRHCFSRDMTRVFDK